VQQSAIANLAPLAALLVLLEVAVGTSVVSHLIDALGRVGRGYVGTTVLICAAMTGIALIIAANLGDPSQVRPGLTTAHLSGVIHWSVGLLVVLLADALFSEVGTEAARKVLAIVVVGVCVGVAASATVFAGALSSLAAAAGVIVSGSLLNGSVWAGMLLGHWYLVTPSMSFKPLRQAVWMIFAAIAAELVIAIAALIWSTHNASARVSGGDQAFLFWVLVIGGGVIFSAVVNALTYYFARTRANQPATAMLYVLIISALMGTIPAQLIFLQTGVGV
jgi:hypothetical protein